MTGRDLHTHLRCTPLIYARRKLHPFLHLPIGSSFRTSLQRTLTLNTPVPIHSPKISTIGMIGTWYEDCLGTLGADATGSLAIADVTFSPGGSKNKLDH